MSQIIPAILTNSAEEYKQKISIVEKIAPRIQVDIADGKFVKNTTISAQEISVVKTNLIIEAHLMVDKPKDYIDALAKTDVRIITVHYEACKDNIFNTVSKIHSLGKKAGLAINPETSLELLKPYFGKIELVLIMGVHPGFSGQKFIPEVLKKIKSLRSTSRNIEIEVDGGINADNIRVVYEAGADYLVIGSGLFENGLDEISVKQSFISLENILKTVHETL